MGANSALVDFDESIIFFDGVCNLCTGSVQFVLKRDTKHHFKFASLQSDFAREHLANVHESLESIILVQNRKVYVKSDAALRIARHLDFPWSLFYGLKLFPKKLRDYVYAIISRNRYRWFGKSDQCMIPSPELSERFVG